MLKIRLLKCFEASLNEESLPGLGPQVRRLLVYLALKANTWVEKEAIGRDLKAVRWSKEDRSLYSPTKDTLRQHLHRLGEALCVEGYRLQGGTGMVRLNLDGAEVDFIAFNKLIQQGILPSLEQAVQLYRGELLADEITNVNYWKEEWEAWVAPVRMDLHQKYLTALQKIQGNHSFSRPRSSAPILEFPGGGVPLDSPYYIERPQDAELGSYITQPGQTLLIKGPRQIGKTSLLTRALHQAQQAGARVLLSDWQNLAQSEIASPEAFFFALADQFAYQLQLNTPPEATFHPRRAPATNFERYVRDYALSSIEAPLVWGIDEADRLFSCQFRDDIFGKLRSWHNDRSSPDSLFRRLTLVLAYSTEAWLFIRDPNMSPFNVGTKFTLQDLTRDQTADLNRRYGSPLCNDEEVAQLQALTGGHPYLIRTSLHTMR